jgi:hypothetical protein
VRERGGGGTVSERQAEKGLQRMCEREREVKIKPRHGKETKRQKRKTER